MYTNATLAINRSGISPGRLIYSDVCVYVVDVYLISMFTYIRLGLKNNNNKKKQ